MVSGEERYKAEKTETENPEGDISTDMRTCPYCLADIPASAVMCKHCGRKSAPRPGRICGRAAASLVFAILGFLFFPLIGSILGIVLGKKAKMEIYESQGNLGGEGMAIAGIVVGWIGVSAVLSGVLILFLLGILNII